MKKCDTLKFGETIVLKKKINFIKNKIIELGDIEANIAEVGVYKGGSAKVIYDVMNKNSNLYLFDTFNGMPYKSDCDNWHNLGDFYDTSYDETCKLFPDINVLIFKGIFPEETGKHIINIKFNLVHLDVDQYLSHKLALEFFYDKMIVGGYIILDDYNSDYCKGATIAVDEFLQKKEEKILIDNDCYYIIKK
jgi:hypothetical protein